MQLFIPGLLQWLQNINWPPCSGCWTQLARFPELAPDPSYAVLRKGDDAEWEHHWQIISDAAIHDLFQSAPDIVGRSSWYLFILLPLSNESFVGSRDGKQRPSHSNSVGLRGLCGC
ncbi:hypothetical protein B0H17DRAFT_648979 [Mycena rosella]|uniref:DUF5071 domain-containing protein n=1 Tax=Mycena rosella TaxID=1033263 RepID=A0AAD7BEA5_MYCRO|nr:hypothetical protein B0H17DRAFT_648979 [Mycena rosella]